MLTTTHKKKGSKAARRLRVRKGGSVERLAAWLTAFALALAGLSLLGVHLPFLTWIDDWGDEIGRVIRAVLVAITIAVFAISARQLQQKTI
ncbi:MAG: hypothetical protein ACJ8J7_17465 [Sulfurifustaceae bacterium]